MGQINPNYCYLGGSIWSLWRFFSAYFHCGGLFQLIWASFFKSTGRGNFKVLWYPFFDPPFLWSQMVKNYFFTIENPFTGFYLAQKYPKRPFENHWSSFSGEGQKLKSGPKAHFLVMEYLETWSACSLQLFCMLKAVKPRKRVW